MFSLLCLAIGRIFEVLVLLGRSREADELEILVLCDELRVAGTSGPAGPLLGARSDPVYRRSRSLPRARWSTTFGRSASDAVALASAYVIRRWIFATGRQGAERQHARRAFRRHAARGSAWTGRSFLGRRHLERLPGKVCRALPPRVVSVADPSDY